MNFYAKDKLNGDSLKREIISETQLAEFSKRRNAEEISFKSKANKVQYFFNTDVLELVEKAEKSQKRENEYLEEAKDLLKKRNKLIEIADKSPGVGLLSMSTITKIMHRTLMIKRKLGPRKTGHYVEYLGINSRASHI